MDCCSARPDVSAISCAVALICSVPVVISAAIAAVLVAEPPIAVVRRAAPRASLPSRD
jgi:hypothetical protein